MLEIRGMMLGVGCGIRWVGGDGIYLEPDRGDIGWVVGCGSFVNIVDALTWYQNTARSLRDKWNSQGR